jgi:hypothetical protein
MRAACQLALLQQSIDIAECLPARQHRCGFTMMGETAAHRQILPGCLRVINHKKAKVLRLSR